ncbi:hypothetical protein M9458_039205, partial [Cirrhinus mrigala]
VGGQTSPNSPHHATITTTGTCSIIIHGYQPGSKHRCFATYRRLSHGPTGALLRRGGGLQGVLTAVLHHMGGIYLDSYHAFAQHFLEVFGRSDQTTSAGEELYRLRQGQGLEPHIRLMLAPHDDSIGLERFIQLAIRCAARNHNPPEPIPEPMVIDTRRLTQTERQRRITQGLCLYCGKPGHHIQDCPTRPLRPVVSSTIDVVLGRPWLARHEPILSWGTGEVLKWGSHCWPECFPQLPLQAPATIPLCSTSIESPIEKQSVEIPSDYEEYNDVFCPKRAARLPPHRPWDCAIDLLPAAQVPHGKIYPLSIPENKAMEDYIQEALAQGYIRSSTSPAASSFFFVAKKDGGLRPCIDYRALNKVTVPFKYPLPLVPAALETLRGAKIFTKLDLHSAYNLIRIRNGDEWKTAFITPTGHYEYLVMPYGLVNAPSIFQNFMHEIFRDYLHQFLLVYIDDILIFSSNIQEHRQHVKKSSSNSENTTCI